MTDYTAYRIKKFSTDIYQSNALTALLKWYGATALMYVPEAAALEFIDMLERGEVELTE